MTAMELSERIGGQKYKASEKEATRHDYTLLRHEQMSTKKYVVRLGQQFPSQEHKRHKGTLARTNEISTPP